VTTPHGPFLCRFAGAVEPGAHVSIAARPEDLALTIRHPGPELNVMSGKIGYRVFLGELIDYIVDHGAGEIRVRAQPDCDFPIGEAVHVGIPPHKCVGFRR
jgi:ABC-type Fe3+/spermidine/putrescine transport system ATPase subunit